MKYLALLLLVVVPTAFADTVFATNVSDISTEVLGMIFGSVGTVLSSSGSQLMGKMFYAYNISVLALGGLVVAYTIIMSVINSANDGEVLGRKWSSMYIPFRTATGMAMLLPNTSGYSLIQIFVMWVVLQGVAAANMIWDSALTYFEMGGASSAVVENDDDLDALIDTSVQIFQLQICTEALQIAVSATDDYAGSVMYPMYYPSQQTGTYGTSSTWIAPQGLVFPGNTYNEFMAVCGYVNGGYTQTSSNGNVYNEGIQAMWLNTMSYARTYVMNGGSDITGSSSADSGLLSAIVAGARDYLGYLRNAKAADKCGVSLDEDSSGSLVASGGTCAGFTDSARESGWIMAGAYFYDILNLRETGGVGLQDNDIPTVNLSYDDQSSAFSTTGELTMLTDTEKSDIRIISQKPGVGKNDAGNDNEDLAAQAKALLDGGIADENVDAMIGSGFTSAKTKMKVGIWKLQKKVTIPFDFTSVIMVIIAYNLFKIKNKIAKLSDPKKGVNANPLASLAKIGGMFFGAALEVWTKSILLALIAGLAGAVGALSPGGYAAISAVLAIVPMLTAMIISFIGLGFTLGFYIPFIPYMLFFFGSLGWLMGVIESMVAAPLVALGIAHPEGHELAGRAAPAVMLLASVFLRPSLMLFGLMAGMALSFAGMRLLALGFNYAAFSLYEQIGNMPTNIFAQIGFMVLFVLIMQQMITMCFQLIHDVPDKVLKWVGGQEQMGSGRGGEQQVQQGLQAAGKAVGEGVSAVTPADSSRKLAEAKKSQWERELNKPGAGEQPPPDGDPGTGGGDGGDAVPDGYPAEVRNARGTAGTGAGTGGVGAGTGGVGAGTGGVGAGAAGTGGAGIGGAGTGAGGAGPGDTQPAAVRRPDPHSGDD